MGQPKLHIIRRPNLLLGLTGTAIAVALLVVSLISSEFNDEIQLINRPVILFVALMTASGGLYLWAVYVLKDTAFSRGRLAWVVLVGVIIRFAMLPSSPILEDDYFRYLWDGGVLANGFNPYRYAPMDITNEIAPPVPEALRQLGADYGTNLEKINYPWLRTIYPPMCQLAFALAHIIKPWSLTAWRSVLFSLDLVTLYLLFLIIRKTDLSPMALLIYWWNPLLIKEIYNSAHMEMVLIPFLLGVFLLFTEGRYLAASGLLGIAVGTKLWPVVLLPIVLKPLLRRPKRLVCSTALFFGLSILLFLPLYLAGLGRDSGLNAYARQWEMNDTAFMLVLWSVEFIMGGLGLNPTNAQFLTRIVVTGLLLGWTLMVVRWDDDTPAEIGRKFLFLVAALFLISPTQFPWYYLWILPFLVIRAQFSLLILTALLPLYYLRYFLTARGMEAIHDYGIVWLEFLPVWFLIIREWYKERRLPR